MLIIDSMNAPIYQTNTDTNAIEFPIEKVKDLGKGLYGSVLDYFAMESL